jgi:hypothetical protein
MGLHVMEVPGTFNYALAQDQYICFTNQTASLNGTLSYNPHDDIVTYHPTRERAVLLRRDTTKWRNDELSSILGATNEAEITTRMLKGMTNRAGMDWSGVFPQELSRVWCAPGIPVWERATAVNRAFTNGTPMQVVVRALGRNYVPGFSIATVWMGPGPEPRKTWSLVYRFGEDTVDIETSAGINEDPLTSTFASAGHSMPAGQTNQKGNRIWIGPSGGATNESHR